MGKQAQIRMSHAFISNSNLFGIFEKFQLTSSSFSFIIYHIHAPRHSSQYGNNFVPAIWPGQISKTQQESLLSAFQPKAPIQQSVYACV